MNRITAISKQIIKCFSVVAFSVGLLAGCAGEKQEEVHIQQNPLLEINRDQIIELRCIGTSSPISGPHFKTTDRAVIDETFKRARALQNDGKPFITMPGNITLVQFIAEGEAALCEISICGDARSIVLHGPGGNSAKTVVVQSPDFAMYCFTLLEKYAPHVLQQMLVLDDRGNRELHLKSFPFDRIKANTEKNK